MVTGTYFNVTTNVGLVWYVTSSTVTNGTTFSVEAQSSTGQLLVRNLWIPTTGSTGNASTDMILTISTQSIPYASGYFGPYNSFHYLLSGSSLALQLKNNSGTTLIYGLDGIVLRI